MIKRESASQLLRFGVVGSIGFAVDALTLHALIWGAGLSPYVARVGSFVAAVTVTWRINRRFTFRRSSRMFSSGGAEYARYVSVQTIGAVLNFGIFAALLQARLEWHREPLVPLAVASLVAMVFNYMALRHFVFRESRRAA